MTMARKTIFAAAIFLAVILHVVVGEEENVGRYARQGGQGGSGGFAGMPGRPGRPGGSGFGGRRPSKDYIKALMQKYLADDNTSYDDYLSMMQNYQYYFPSYFGGGGRGGDGGSGGGGGGGGGGGDGMPGLPGY